MQSQNVRNLIIILTTGWFPEGAASAIRIQMLAKIYIENGFRVLVLCRGKENDKGSIEGIEYISLRTNDRNIMTKYMDFILYTNRAKRIIKDKLPDIYAIHLCGSQIRLHIFCKKIHRSKQIQLIHDCVEWFSPDEYKLGIFNKAFVKNNFKNSKLIDRNYKVIAISRYLENYFKKKGIDTLRLPIMCDYKKRTYYKQISNKHLTLFYGGLPGTKDLVENFLKAALLLSHEEQTKLHIIFVGTSKEYLIKKSNVDPKIIEDCNSFLELHDRTTRGEVLRIMESADFAILARDASLRYAKAGFPSKIVEALANATPVLCNYSSDLDMYLIDGNNSIISKSHEPEDLLVAIRKAMALSLEEKNNMSMNALKTARDCFDYKLYVNDLGKFIVE